MAPAHPYLAITTATERSMGLTTFFGVRLQEVLADRADMVRGVQTMAVSAGVPAAPRRTAFGIQPLRIGPPTQPDRSPRRFGIPQEQMWPSSRPVRMPPVPTWLR